MTFRQDDDIPARLDRLPWSRWQMLTGGSVAAAVLLALWWAGRPWGSPLAQAEPHQADSGAAAEEAAPLATRPRPSPVLPPGRIRVLTSPPDAEIFIDGHRVGIGSLFDHPVTAGERRLRIQAPGYRTFDTVIVIPSENTLSLGRIALADRSTSP